MKHLMTFAAGLALAGLSGPLAADSSARSGAELVTVHDVEFRGRPPFRRSVERLPAAEVARLEAGPEIENGDQVVTVSRVDFYGKPPFKRTTETLTLREMAQLEVLPEGGEHRGNRFNRRGFKGHAR